MTVISMTDMRHAFSDIVNQVIYRGERICVAKNGKPAFALVSIEDVRILEQLEDEIDIEAVKKALKRGKFISLGQLEKKLGL